ncbi:hypothetical protein V8C86DRAFT_2993437, partial [Haematococcus lacustris]
PGPCCCPGCQCWGGRGPGRGSSQASAWACCCWRSLWRRKAAALALSPPLRSVKGWGRGSQPSALRHPLAALLLLGSWAALSPLYCSPDSPRVLPRDCGCCGWGGRGGDRGWLGPAPAPAPGNRVGSPRAEVSRGGGGGLGARGAVLWYGSPQAACGGGRCCWYCRVAAVAAADPVSCCSNSLRRPPLPCSGVGDSTPSSATSSAEAWPTQAVWLSSAATPSIARQGRLRRAARLDSPHLAHNRMTAGSWPRRG